MTSLTRKFLGSTVFAPSNFSFAIKTRLCNPAANRESENGATVHERKDSKVGEKKRESVYERVYEGESTGHKERNGKGTTTRRPITRAHKTPSMVHLGARGPKAVRPLHLSSLDLLLIPAS